jgi:hypothetical protein
MFGQSVKDAFLGQQNGEKIKNKQREFLLGMEIRPEKSGVKMLLIQTSGASGTLGRLFSYTSVSLFYNITYMYIML